MKARNESWQIRKLVAQRAKIDPKPQYQRGDVWKTPKRQLLIDSILRGFDIPKIYLQKIGHSGSYQYEVVDGQQRLVSIWNFIDGHYPLARSTAPDTTDWGGHQFEGLSQRLQKRILNYKIVASVIDSAEKTEIRELFARLQKGERLTPPELRNSMPSALGDMVRAMADSHKFFKNCAFPSTRLKHADLAAHAFALEVYGASRNLKAQDLAQMYEEFAGGVEPEVAKRVNENLAFLDSMQTAQKGCIRTKWGFVDLYLLVKSNGHSGSPLALAHKYVLFEKKRLAYVADPAQLLDGSKKDRDLYAYITSFEKGGGIAENIKIRAESLARKLLLAGASGQ